MSADKPTLNTRRDFLKVSTAAAAVGAAFPYIASGAPNDQTLKVGLVGCGGRGSGAATQALNADKNVKLVAMADAFEGNLKSSLGRLEKSHGPKVDVTPEMQFVGLDAYKKLIATDVDVVLLATPPGFRPIMLKEAVEAGKHIFCEKPMAVDAPGVRMVMEAAKTVKAKQKSLVCGFCWRYNYERRAAFEEIHGGRMGDIVSYYAPCYPGPVKPMPPAKRRAPEDTDVLWQVKNWYNFTWTCGDSLVEQAVHSVDKISWAMKDQPPLAAVATGGRQVPAEGGNIFDHFQVNYEYPNGVRAFMGSRQQRNCHGENADYIMGTKGQCIIGQGPVRIVGDEKWRYRGEGGNMYQIEHDELFASIRSGEPMNDGEWMATSTMLAIMGRMAAYTGKKVTWDQALNSTEDLAPDVVTWDSKFHVHELALPGVTKFV